MSSAAQPPCQKLRSNEHYSVSFLHQFSSILSRLARSQNQFATFFPRLPHTSFYDSAGMTLGVLRCCDGAPKFRLSTSSLSLEGLLTPYPKHVAPILCWTVDPQCIWIYILAEGHPPLEAISNDRLQTQTLYRAKDRGMFTVLCFRRSKLALWNSHLPLVLDMKPFLERFLDLSFTILDIDRLCVNHHSNHSNPFVRFVHPCVERTALNNDGPRLCNGLGCAILEDEGEFSRDFSRQWGTIQGARADMAR